MSAAAVRRPFYALVAAFVAASAILTLAVAPIGYDNMVGNACSEIADRYAETELYGADWRGFRKGYVCVVSRGDGTKITEHRVGLWP